PFAGSKARKQTLSHADCRVFQPRCLRLKFIKAGERGVEVCLVEDFAVIDSVGVDNHELDASPLGVEAFCRGPVLQMRDDRSETAEPMHRLDLNVNVWRDVPNSAEALGHGAGLERGSPPV